jgi:hypothetical protein
MISVEIPFCIELLPQKEVTPCCEEMVGDPSPEYFGRRWLVSVPFVVEAKVCMYTPRDGCMLAAGCSRYLTSSTYNYKYYFYICTSS